MNWEQLLVVEPLFFDFRKFQQKVGELYFNFVQHEPDHRHVETEEMLRLRVFHPNAILAQCYCTCRLLY